MNIIGKNPIGDSPIGFDGLLQADNVIPVAWYEAFDPIDRVMPIEWGQFLEVDNVIPVDWTIEIFIEAFGIMPFEFINEFEMDPQVILYEHRGTILANPGNIPFEYKNIVDPSDHKMPITWQEYLSSSHILPFEYLNKLDTDQQVLLMEWKNQLDPFDRVLNLEYINQISPSDHVIPYSWAEGRELDFSIPFEYLASIEKYSVIPYEHREAVLVGGDNTLLIEWLASITQDHKMPYHWFEGREIDHAIPIQIIGTVIHDGLMPIEWLASITQDHKMPYHWFEGREIDHAIPISINQQLLLDRILLIDSDGVLLPTQNTNVGKIFNIEKREFSWVIRKPTDQYWNIEKREFTWNVRRKDKY